MFYLWKKKNALRIQGKPLGNFLLGPFFTFLVTSKECPFGSTPLIVSTKSTSETNAQTSITRCKCE